MICSHLIGASAEIVDRDQRATNYSKLARPAGCGPENKHNQKRGKEP